MTRIHFHITDQQAKGLAQLAWHYRTSLAEETRKAIDLHLRDSRAALKKGEKMPKNNRRKEDAI